MSSVNTTNKKITNVAGTSMDVVEVRELRTINNVGDADMIEITISNETDDTYEKILKFLSEDISTIRYEADLTYIEQDGKKQHYMYDMVDYTGGYDISYGGGMKQYDQVERYHILIKRQTISDAIIHNNKEYIDTLYMVIADEYENITGGGTE